MECTFEIIIGMTTANAGPETILQMHPPIEVIANMAANHLMRNIDTDMS